MMTTHVPCALCNFADTRLCVKKFEQDIVCCNHCGLVYANPRIPAEAILGRYSAEYFWNEYLPTQGVQQGVYDLKRFDKRYASTLSLMRKFVGTPGRMLEIGTGAGFFLKAAERAGWDVTGLEISDEAVAFAQQELGLNVVKTYAEDLDYPQHVFDAVVMLDVVEHLFEPRQVLEKVRHVLRPGGMLLITTPNFDALSRNALGKDWAVLSPSEHLYYFTETTLQAMLEVASFRQVQFVREAAGQGVLGTMNPGYTHAPNSLRARLYWMMVFGIGLLAYRWIRAKGWGDTLFCVAR